MTDSIHQVIEVEDGAGSTDDTKAAAPSLYYQCLAEAFGTCFIVIVGVNAVHGAVLAGGAAGNFQVGMMFALGIMWGIYTAGSVSLIYFNPQQCMMN